jgi:hypothetical protein
MKMNLILANTRVGLKTSSYQGDIGMATVLKSARELARQSLLAPSWRE